MANITLESVGKNYTLGETTIQALNGINLSIEFGELVIIFGPSGAGKTTLLNMIGGLDVPTSGKVTVGEIPVSTLSAKWLTIYRRKKVGVVFQFFNLISRLSALENVEYALELVGVKKGSNGEVSYDSKLIRETAIEYLTKVGLQDRIHHFPAQLSGGEQQRVAIARALAKEPEILLADEPTGNLDFKIGRQVLEIMEAMTGKKLNRTVVIVTHNEAICPLGDRVIRLSDGRIVEDYTQKFKPAKDLYW
ncbi:MAG: ABC transporter ATP-binding protein [Candidatus Heimdallarchaeota archaeon]|nr:MAG: ABC transporter ATP-binding protein [Candidatus Heimdallarchaeota archaeon]